MEHKNLIIGVLGGMGTYATIHLFKQYAEIFEAKKEWDRPRMIIDNRCTMPSRVRAILYSENKEILIDEMSQSVAGLISSGCNKIFLACNTAQLFIPDIIRLVPDAREKLINIIDVCAAGLSDDHVKEVYLLASEGTISSGIYQKAFDNCNITCRAPESEEFPLIRECIEAVKQNQYNDEVRDIFIEMINRNNTCILGCTELPVLYEKYRDKCQHIRVYDPVYMTLEKLRSDNEKNTDIWSV